MSDEIKITVIVKHDYKIYEEKISTCHYDNLPSELRYMGENILKKIRNFIGNDTTLD